MAQQTAISVESPAAQAGKYLAFRLGRETYGLKILQVREIIGLMDVTPVPLMPAFIKGVINLRGRVIPVTDLRQKFGISTSEPAATGCIIVVCLGELEMGLMVDQVLEVVEIMADQIEATPSFGSEVDAAFILGIGTAGGRVTLLLDLEKVLTSQEMAQLKKK